jgi:hypothetical protein
MNIFEKASRDKLRFATHRGSVSVEDLWDLPLSSMTGKVNLDEIAISLHKQLRSTDVMSFVDDKATADPTIQLRFDIVKHVIETRKAENAKVLSDRAKAEKKQVILAALARKRESAIETASEEDLQKMLSEL